MKNEEEFGKGAVRDIADFRDYQWGRDVGMAAQPFDWEKGYDVEAEISAHVGYAFKLKNKDQNGSGSCGGQAWSYYGCALNAFHDKNVDERSAKFIYAHTFVKPAGSGGRENSILVCEKGWGFESDTPSYDNGNPPGEAFMQRKVDISDQAYARALPDRALAYANVPLSLELIAQAVRDNHGAIFGVTGVNNGTWRSAYPQPPTTFQDAWNHWLYVGKLKLVNGVKMYGTFNSWGTDIGEDGWQWLSEEYVMKKIVGYPVIWSVWTMVMKDEVVPPVVTYTFTKTLRKGMRSADVKMLQLKVGAKVDGIFGPATEAKLKAFQEAHGLVADGIAGPKTNAVLNTL